MDQIWKSPFCFYICVFLMLSRIPLAAAAAEGHGSSRLEKSGTSLSLSIDGRAAGELFEALNVPGTVTDVGDTYKTGRNVLCVKRNRGALKQKKTEYFCSLGIDAQGRVESAD